ncbi:MAG: FAD-dependent monooxygenase [Polyangiaceae bacterium]
MKRVLISGAGVAGPALAFWLSRFGYRVTLVERASALREGGQAVDFRGPVHRTVLERMGLWGALEQLRTQPQAMAFVDAQGEPYVRLPEVMMAGDLEVLRGDLCRLLYERTERDVDYRFGERIVALQEEDAGVTVDFEHAARERFDLVIGADGLHSGLRRLAFGPETAHLRHHDYRIASFAAPHLRGKSGLTEVYSVPGRAVSRQRWARTHGLSR